MQSAFLFCLFCFGHGIKPKHSTIVLPPSLVIRYSMSNSINYSQNKQIKHIKIKEDWHYLCTKG